MGLHPIQTATQYRCESKSPLWYEKEISVEGENQIYLKKKNSFYNNSFINKFILTIVRGVGQNLM